MQTVIYTWINNFRFAQEPYINLPPKQKYSAYKYIYLQYI